MAAREYLHRYSIIIRFLQAHPYQTTARIARHVEDVFREKELGEGKENLGLSSRNLQRDFKVIRDLFGFEIVHCPREGGYHIADDPNGYEQSRILEAFELTSAISQSVAMKPAMQLEQRKAEGTDHMMPLLHAIEAQKKVRFQYQKFWDDAAKKREVKPLLLKEFRHRWYLLAMDEMANELRTFALDRIAALDTLNQRFVLDEAANNALARIGHSYGITVLQGQPTEVVLAFSALQGMYVKTLPLHPSQQVLEDTEEVLKVSLKVFVSRELEMDLLSFGAEVKVISPKALAEAIAGEHRKAAQH